MNKYTLTRDYVFKKLLFAEADRKGGCREAVEGLGRSKAMALVSTRVSCRKAFGRADSAASKDNFLKEVGISSINLNSEAFSS